MDLPEDVIIQKQLTQLHLQKWQSEELFQPRWWLVLALFVVVLIIWLVLIKKERLLEVCLYAVLAGILFLGIDEYGEELTLWDYPVDILPLFPPLSSVNMFMLPLGFSLIYQYFKTTRVFVIVAAALSALMCFAIEPLLAAGDLYRLIHWHYYESLPLYFLLAVVTRMLIRRILMTESNEQINAVGDEKFL